MNENDLLERKKEISTTRDNVVDKVVPSTPGNTPDDLNKYLSSQRQQINQYGPDQEKMVLEKILQDRNSLGENLKRGAIGFSDAIMQGVARAGNPGNLSAYDARKAKEEEIRANSIPALQEMNLKQVEGNQALDRMSGDNPMGASFQAPLAAFFKKAGVPEDQIPSMLANPSAARSVVDPFASLMANEQKLQMELLLNQLNQRGAKEKAILEAATAKEKAAAEAKEKAGEKEEREKKAKVDAAEKLSKLGPLDKLILKRQEANVLKEAAGLGEEIIKVNSEEEASSLPPGTRFELNGRKGTVR